MRVALMLLVLVSASPISAAETGDADHHFHHNNIGLFLDVYKRLQDISKTGEDSRGL